MNHCFDVCPKSNTPSSPHVRNPIGTINTTVTCSDLIFLIHTHTHHGPHPATTTPQPSVCVCVCFGPNQPHQWHAKSRRSVAKINVPCKQIIKGVQKINTISSYAANFHFLLFGSLGFKTRLSVAKALFIMVHGLLPHA